MSSPVAAIANELPVETIAQVKEHDASMVFMAQTVH